MWDYPWADFKEKDYLGLFLAMKENLQENFFSLVLSNFCLGMELDISSVENKLERVEGNITATEGFDFTPPPPLKLPVSKWGDRDPPVLLTANSI